MAITELITTNDFQESQRAFIEQNYQHFVDDDENKHIYKTVYDNYLEIMENTIESKLIGEFSFQDEEINHFYTSFADKKQHYEQINVNTVDALFSFIDFDRFKKEMLEMKKSIEDKQGTTEIEVNAVDTILNQNNDLESQYQSFEQLQAEDKSKWQLKSNQKDFKNGVKINMWQRKQADSPNDILYVRAQYKGITAEEFVHYYMNPQNLPIMEELKILEKKGPYDQT